MTRMRSWMIFVLSICVTAAQAQAWIGEYDKGLDAAKKGEWTTARAFFQQAVAFRPEDADKPTTLPGPVTEVRRWRNGAAYSPNFLAAYSAYRQGMLNKDQEKTSFLQQAAGELSMLLDKGQTSKEAFYFLNNIYTTLGDTAKRQALEAKFSQLGGKATFKVDTEIVAPEELASIASMGGGASTPNTTPVKTIPKTDPSGAPVNPTKGTTPPLGGPLVGAVAKVPNKFALIIGNGDSKIKDMAIPYAADDAQQIREALVTNAGYMEENVDLVLNATAEQIMRSAKALSDRVDDTSVIYIFFSGVGVNIAGKDFLTGIDTESVMDTGSMASKAAIFNLFLSKGSRVFSFFQANRPIVAGRFFGQEVPTVGPVAQTQATIPGDNVFGFVQNGKMTGLFANSVIRVMAEQKSNQLPILEFGWQIFNKMRRGDSGITGGSSRQTCTLPVLTNLASDARF